MGPTLYGKGSLATPCLWCNLEMLLPPTESQGISKRHKRLTILIHSAHLLKL